MNKRIRRAKDDTSAFRCGDAPGRRFTFETRAGREGHGPVRWFRDGPDGGTFRLGLCPRIVMVREVAALARAPASPAVTWLFARGGMSLVLVASLMILGLVGGLVAGR